MKRFPLLYKLSKNGSPQQWQIIVDGDSFYTEAGQVDGVITRSEPTVCEPKNTGRANATTAEQQAELEAGSKHNKKIEKGYVTSLDNAGQGPDYFEPMLAHKFEERKNKITYPVLVQRKSDGIRAVITRHGATTRNGKPHKCVPHILEALQSFFEKYPNAILDGELYNHELHDDFNKISSLIRKSKPTNEDLQEAARLVQFHCYDAPRVGNFTEKDPFSARYLILAKELTGLADCIEVVLTYKVTDEDGVKRYHEQFVAEGYEGIMVRIDAAYECKRSNNLLKFKEFDDDEFVIEGVLTGKGNKANMAGAVELHSKSGEYFTSNIKATHEVLESILKHREKYIGKTCTVRYFGLTPDKGIPRFPYVIDMDRWTYE